MMGAVLGGACCEPYESPNLRLNQSVGLYFFPQTGQSFAAILRDREFTHRGRRFRLKLFEQINEEFERRADRTSSALG